MKLLDQKVKANNIVLSLKNVTVHYGKVVALKNVNITIERYDYVGIIGPNGGGKTTLLKAILGLVPLKNGQVIMVNDMGRKQKMGYVPQYTNLDKNFPISLEEVVLSGRMTDRTKPFFTYKQDDIQLTEEILENTELLHLRKRKISDLSGGQFQRMLIARALCTEPEILLLDEPTANVDPQSRELIFDLLNKLNEKMTIILVTHDMMAISAHVKNIACLNQELVYHGIPEITEENITKMYGCPVDVIAHGIPHRVLKKHERN